MLRLPSPLGPLLSLPKTAPAPARRVRSGGAAATSLACAHLRPALPLRPPASDPTTLSNRCASFRPPTRLRPYPPPRFSRRPSPASAPRTSTSDRGHVLPVPRPAGSRTAAPWGASRTGPRQTPWSTAGHRRRLSTWTRSRRAATRFASPPAARTARCRCTEADELRGSWRSATGRPSNVKRVKKRRRWLHGVKKLPCFCRVNWRRKAVNLRSLCTYNTRLFDQN